MAEISKKSVEAKDYKERFQFCLTVGDNIICKRYFKINNFNPACLRSYELIDAVQRCARVIDNDLKDKTQVYLEIFAPRIFDSVDEMNTYLSNPENARSLRTGEGIVVRGSDVDYFWADTEVRVSNIKFDDGELSRPLSDEDRVMYKFAFLVDEEEVCSAVWEGVYPKFIRNSIDISNKRGKFEDEDINHLSFERYLLYKLVENRGDLVWGLIKEICKACSSSFDSDYTTKAKYGDTTYKNPALRKFQFVNTKS